MLLPIFHFIFSNNKILETLSNAYYDCYTLRVWSGGVRFHRAHAQIICKLQPMCYVWIMDSLLGQFWEKVLRPASTQYTPTTSYGIGFHCDLGHVSEEVWPLGHALSFEPNWPLASSTIHSLPTSFRWLIPSKIVSDYPFSR